MGNDTDPSNSDEEGLDAAEEEVDEEPEPGLGPGADEEEDADEN